MLIVIMGVAGSGKTTGGRALAKRRGWRFSDHDDFHPPANVEKMRAGRPLDDHDRGPWLDRLNALLRHDLAKGHPVVLACSALKQRYRDRLAVDGTVRFVHLQGDYDLVMARLLERPGHFMKADMLASQFAALEPPREAVVIDIRAPVAEIVAEIRQRLDIR